MPMANLTYSHFNRLHRASLAPLELVICERGKFSCSYSRHLGHLLLLLLLLSLPLLLLLLAQRQVCHYCTAHTFTIQDIITPWPVAADFTGLPPRLAPA